MADDPRRSLGQGGETVAAEWLRRAGLTIVARGFRARCGEIDVIAKEGATLVFVEVKTRSGDGFGRPADAVTAEKRRRIARVASVFLAESRCEQPPCRFDVVEVVPGRGSWRVRHIRDAFRPGD